jgi:uncharacterized protein YabE (DUF348 family)
MTSIFSIHNHKKSVKQHPFRRVSYLAVILAIIAIPFLSHQAFANTVSSTAQLYIDGKVVNVATNAKTVKGVIEDAGFTVGKSDKVEPSLETEVTDGYKINVYRAIPITVEDKGVNVEIETAQKTGESIASEAGIALNPEDKFDLQTSDLSGNDLKPGLTMKVDRAETINLNLYGAVTQVRTQEKTVGDFLTAHKIQLQAGDTLLQPTDQAIIDGGSIEIKNDSREVAVIDEEIPMPEEIVRDVNKDAGYKEVTTTGSVGQKKVTYEIKKENGKEISRTAIEEVVIKPATKQVTIVGTKSVGPGVNVSAQAKELMAQAGISASDYTYAYFIIDKESHWRPGVSNYNGSGAYGLCQALPGSKMASAGADWRTNPVTQLKWCSGYANSRYGSWKGAYEYWMKKHWW